MKTTEKLIWSLFPSYLLIVVIALVTIVLYTSTSLHQLYLKQTQQELEAHARLTRKLLEDEHDRSMAHVDAFCKTIGKELAIRLTVILLSGQVLGDSEENPANMDNHADRPEIRKAFSEQVGSSTRYSYTVEKDMMYVAIPATQDGKLWGVVRASMPVTTVNQILNAMYRKMVWGGIAVSLLAAIISLFVSYRISSPLEEIKQGAVRFANGDLKHRLRVSGALEIKTLAHAMNRMATQLDERLDIVMEQRNELESMLSSMVEAVIVVDTEGRIIRSNQAAGSLFGFRIEAAEKRNIQEIVRNADVQRFMKTTLRHETPMEEVIMLHGNHEQFLRAHGTLLRNASGQTAGILLVFHNITRLKQLENIRRDFVANVSHELKTPITSICGFVETLQNGAIAEPENAARFLDIIARNARRLNSIIEDLLSLSKIEQEEEKGHISLALKPVSPILETAVMVCSPKSLDKEVSIELFCDDSLTANVNAELLEQAVINLLDNAIKYSDPTSLVTVRATRSDGNVTIAVQDSGCGISQEHHARLFERFYRVDKARSRKLGGTGLGLAIVKHIVQAHRGTVSVDSLPGEGSTFSITLPAV